MYHVGFVFQRYHLLPHWSIKDNLHLYEYISYRQGTNNIQDLCDRLDLHEKNNKKAFQLSGGQQIRYALIRALRKEPSILLCDEPTSALDCKTAKKMMSLLQEYAKEHIVIIVSHDQSLLYEYCDEVLVMEKGKLSKTIVESHGVMAIKQKQKYFSSVLARMIVLKNRILAKKERNGITLLSIGFATFCLLMTVLFSISLKEGVFQEIQKLFPENSISVKSKELFSLEKAQEIINTDEQFYGGYLNLPQVEFYGLSTALEDDQTLFIGDHTRIAHENVVLLQGRMPTEYDEVLLSRNTYERLWDNFEEERVVYTNYLIKQKHQKIPLKVVGIIDEYTAMDTMYQLSLAESYLLKENNVLIQGDFLMLYCKQDVNKAKEILEETYDLESKVVGDWFMKTVDDLLHKINYLLYGISGIVLVAVFLFLAMAVYLNTVEKVKEVGILRMMGASLKDILYLEFYEVILLCFLGSLGGNLMMVLTCQMINTIFRESLNLNIALSLNAATVIWMVSLILFLGNISAIVPIYLLGKRPLDTCLQAHSY